MENTVLKASYLKHLKISTEPDKQHTSVLPVRIHGQMNNWILDEYNIHHHQTNISMIKTKFSKICVPQICTITLDCKHNLV